MTAWPVGFAFATQTVTVQRAALVLDHGNQVFDWDSPIEHTVGGCSIQPATGAEDSLNRDAVTTLWTVFAPIDEDITDTDRVVVYGIAYDIDGPIKRWATGVLDHLEIPLRTVSG